MTAPASVDGAPDGNAETRRTIAASLLEAAVAPKLSAQRDAIFLNSALYARVQALYDQRNSLNLDPESKYLLERYYKDFVRAGAKLSEADKTKLKAMNAELDRRLGKDTA